MNKVDGNRSLLKALLGRNKREGNVGKEANTYDRIVDIEEINRTLADLKDRLDSGVAISSKNEECRFADRLRHLTARVGREIVSEGNSTEENLVKDLEEECLLLEDRWEEIRSSNKVNQEELDLVQQVDPLPQQLSSGLQAASQQQVNAPKIFARVQSESLQTDVTGGSNVSESIRKWNIRFSGTEAPEKLFDFLESIDDLRISRGVTKQQLFNAAVELFNDDARVWFV